MVKEGRRRLRKKKEEKTAQELRVFGSKGNFFRVNGLRILIGF